MINIDKKRKNREDEHVERKQNATETLLAGAARGLLTIFFLVDCYVNVAFGKQSQFTEVLTQTLCPCWDQTLIFDDVDIHESLDDIVAHPPRVFLEFFDKDVFVRYLTERFLK